VEAIAVAALSDRFLCDARGCAARHPQGAVVVITDDEEEARGRCGTAAVIVLADAASRLRCDDASVLVISTRDLARRGSASVRFPQRIGSARPSIEFATSPGRHRPWHRHRVYSREARGLPAWQRDPAPSRPESGNRNPGSELPVTEQAAENAPAPAP
jgi:hypothetical protein